jgi:glutamine synthetase
MHIRPKEGYVPVAPMDTLIDLRNAISMILGEVGIHVECHHHEVATAGQCEIDFRFSNLLHTADNMMMFKYIVKNTAYAHGKTATFMPKPLYGDNGSGMHCHQSLWKDGRAAVRRRPIRGIIRDGEILHRRTFETRACLNRSRCADDKQLQASRSRI